MLDSLNIKNFTVFLEENITFCHGLNVVIGENGTGKTHLLKLAYLLSNAGHNLVKKQSMMAIPKKTEQYFSEHLQGLFKPDSIGSLTTTNSESASEVTGFFSGIKWQFSFSTNSNDDVIVNDSNDKLNNNNILGKSLYLPSKEMISFFDGFLALYEKHEIQFDETYRDLALHLSTPKLKLVPEMIANVLADLSHDIGGTLKLKGGKFYLLTNNSKPKEITLVAEGIRKLATLMHLIENGSLESGDTLFWDEPESNLNAKLIKNIAGAILFLCKNGIQVVLATHSLFLLRELEILSSSEKFDDIPQRYFVLEKKLGRVDVHQSDSLDDLEPLVMLDESLLQSERFMELS